MNSSINIRSFIFSAIVIFVSVVCIFFYETLKTETANSIRMCVYVIVPSLYGSMILACLITKSRFHIIMGKIFSPLSRYVFKLTPELFSIFILSNISGYPVGAKLLQNKEIRITDDEYNRCMCFCFSSGPAFIIATVALKLYNSVYTGLIIFISVFFSNIILAFISGIGKPVPVSSHERANVRLDSRIITESINNASSGMMQMCIMIIAFAVFKIIIIETGISRILSFTIAEYTSLSLNDSRSFILSLLEISNITGFEQNNFNNIPVVAFLLSAGGICTFMQVIAISENRINALKFFIYRIIGAFISYFTCSIIIRFFFSDLIVSASSFQIHSSQYSIFQSVILLIMTILLISQKAIDKSNLK